MTSTDRPQGWYLLSASLYGKLTALPEGTPCWQVHQVRWLSFYRVVRPDGDVGWAYASQSRSALTLQTCVSGGKMRLVVRFYEVKRP